MIRTHYENVKNTIGDHVQLCIVTKRRSTEEILSYYEAGERMFAENHAQQLKVRAAQLPSDIRWQFIGHLQRNKVKYLMDKAVMIHSVDSASLAAWLTASSHLITFPLRR